MPDQGFDGDLLQVLREKFKGRATLNFKDSSKLLKLNEKTLRRHVRLGNITFRQTGFGTCRVRREFALEDIAGFYVTITRRLEPAAQAMIARVRTAGRRSFLEGYAARKVARSNVRGGRKEGSFGR